MVKHDVTELERQMADLKRKVEVAEIEKKTLLVKGRRPHDGAQASAVAAH